MIGKGLPGLRVTLCHLLKLGYLKEAGGSDAKESACKAGDPGSIPGLGSSPWRKEQLPIPVFWPGESQGQRSQVGYSP